MGNVYLKIKRQPVWLEYKVMRKMVGIEIRKAWSNLKKNISIVVQLVLVSLKNKRGETQTLVVLMNTLFFLAGLSNSVQCLFLNPE